MAYSLVDSMGCRAQLSNVERFALLLACLSHDLGHPGAGGGVLWAIYFFHSIAILYHSIFSSFSSVFWTQLCISLNRAKQRLSGTKPLQPRRVLQRHLSSGWLPTYQYSAVYLHTTHCIDEAATIGFRGSF